MVKIVWFSVVLCLLFGLPAPGFPSAMVERHIFSPEPECAAGMKSPEAAKLEKELLFTGVIITSEGKWAMIREKRKGSDEPGLRKEGDEIKGMVIKHIASNYLILAGKGSDLRLNLYAGGKKRPFTPPQVAKSVGSKGQAPSAPSAIASKVEKKKPAAPAAKPGRKSRPGSTVQSRPASAAKRDKSAPASNLAEALKRAVERSKSEGGESPPANNPFLEAIRRAQGR